MKKILLASFIFTSFITFGFTGYSEISSNRGFELIREANFNQISDLSKESGSLQTFELFSERDKNFISKGILLGTVSNFIDFPNIHAGLTVAYQKYNLKNFNRKDREYALNTYISYQKNNYLGIASIGYSQARNVEKRAYSGNIELGKFLNEANLNHFNKGKFYIYTGVSSQKWNQKHTNNIRYLNYRLGLTSYHFLDRFRFVGNIEVNADNKEYEINRGKYNFAFSYAIGYNIYDDLLVELKYKGIKNKDFYNNLFSLGFTHIF